MLFSAEELVQETAQAKPPIPDALQAIISEFADIFETPFGLPPHRPSDQKIPLLPGTTPPKIRPYRMSQS
jgi:hypothetical protein